MLSEIALTPDIFDGACYSSAAACDLHLSYLKEPLLSEALVRDLRDGEWAAYLKNELGRWHPRGKELFKKLITQKRLRLFPAAGAAVPADDNGWCLEALASHGVEALGAVLTTTVLAARYASSPVVCSVEKVMGSAWWHGRTPSARPERTITSYMQHLGLVIPTANSFMFIDPHLDPSKARYGDFIQLLLALRRPRLTPQIEIHRVCYEGSGPGRTLFVGANRPVLEQRFRDAWSAALHAVGLNVTVYVWPDFHDRFLITDLIGIQLSNGFDRGLAAERTTWGRLGRAQADQIQREFDPAAAIVKPHYIFAVP